MNKPLPKTLDKYVKSKVRSGEFESPNDVILAALRLLKDRDALRAARLEEMRAQVRDGIEAADRGRVHPIEGTVERVRARVERRARPRRKSA